MFRIRCAMMFALISASLVLTGGISPAGPQEKKDKNDKPGNQIPGARYSYKAVEVGKDDVDGKEIDSGVFRADKNKLYKGPTNQIGSYLHTTKDEVHLDIEKGKLKGKMVLARWKQGKQDSPTWKGTWKSDDGGKYRMTLILIKD